MIHVSKNGFIVYDKQEEGQTERKEEKVMVLLPIEMYERERRD